MFDLVALGAEVKQRRGQVGLTQGELAQRAKVSRPQIDRLENARLPDTGVKALLRILNAVGLDLRVVELRRERPTLDELREEEEEA